MQIDPPFGANGRDRRGRGRSRGRGRGRGRGGFPKQAPLRSSTGEIWAQDPFAPPVPAAPSSAWGNRPRHETSAWGDEIQPQDPFAPSIAQEPTTTWRQSARRPSTAWQPTIVPQDPFASPAAPAPSNIWQQAPQWPSTKSSQRSKRGWGTDIEPQDPFAPALAPAPAPARRTSAHRYPLRSKVLPSIPEILPQDPFAASSNEEDPFATTTHAADVWPRSRRYANTVQDVVPQDPFVTPVETTSAPGQSWGGTRHVQRNVAHRSGAPEPNILIRGVPQQLFNPEAIKALFPSMNILDVTLRASRHNPPHRTAVVYFPSLSTAQHVMQNGVSFEGRQLSLSWFTRNQVTEPRPTTARILIRAVPHEFYNEPLIKAHFADTAHVAVQHVSLRTSRHRPPNRTALLTFANTGDAEQAMQVSQWPDGQRITMAFYPSREPASEDGDGLPGQDMKITSRPAPTAQVSAPDPESTALDPNAARVLERKAKEMQLLQHKIRLLEERKARMSKKPESKPSQAQKPDSLPSKGKPFSKMNIKNAKKFVGTCPTMCPADEMKRRVIERDVSIFERLPGDTYSIDPARAVKKYRRSAANSEEPSPSEVRPSHVLSKTMDFLLEICDNESQPFDIVHNFVRDRTRSIRQDFTLQGITDDTCIQIHEQSVRFHILSEHRLFGTSPELFSSNQNQEQLDKCLISLRQMYAERRKMKIFTSENEPEMQAYYLLFHLFHPETSIQVYSELPRHVLQSDEVQFAIQVAKMVASPSYMNYAAYFNAVRAAPYLVACLLHRNFAKIRSHAIRAMTAAYSQSSANGASMPLNFLQSVLAFESAVETANFCAHYELPISRMAGSTKVELRPIRTPEPAKVLKAVLLIESKASHLKPSEVITYVASKAQPEVMATPEKSPPRKMSPRPVMDSQAEISPLKAISSLHEETPSKKRRAQDGPKKFERQLEFEPKSTAVDPNVDAANARAVTSPLLFSKHRFGEPLAAPRLAFAAHPPLASHQSPFLSESTQRKDFEKNDDVAPGPGRFSFDLGHPKLVENAIELAPVPAERPEEEDETLTDPPVEKAEDTRQAEQLRKETEQDQRAEQQITMCRGMFWKTLEDPQTSLSFVEEKLSELPNAHIDPKGLLEHLEVLDENIAEAKKSLGELEQDLRRITPVFADTEEQLENLMEAVAEQARFAEELGASLWQHRYAAKLVLLRSGAMLGTPVDYSELQAAYARNQKPSQSPRAQEKPAPKILGLTEAQKQHREDYLCDLFAAMRESRILRFKLNILQVDESHRHNGIAHEFCKKLLAQAEDNDDPATFPVVYAEEDSYHCPTLIVQSTIDNCHSLHASNVVVIGVDPSHEKCDDETGGSRIAAALSTILSDQKSQDFPRPFLLVVSETCRKGNAVSLAELEVELKLAQLVENGTLSGFKLTAIRATKGVDNSSAQFFKTLQSISLKEIKKLVALRMSTITCRIGDVAVRTATVAWREVFHKYKESIRSPYFETIVAINKAWANLKLNIGLERSIWPPEHTQAQSTLLKVEQKLQDRLHLPQPSFLKASNPREYLAKIANIVAPDKKKAHLKRVKTYHEFLFELSRLMLPIVSLCLEEEFDTRIQLHTDTANPSTHHLAPLRERTYGALGTPVEELKNFSNIPADNGDPNARCRRMSRTTSEPPAKRTRQGQDPEGTVTVNRELQFTPAAHARDAALHTSMRGKRTRPTGVMGGVRGSAKRTQKRRLSLPSESERAEADFDGTFLTDEILERLIEIEREHGKAIERTIRRIQACIDAGGV